VSLDGSFLILNGCSHARPYALFAVSHVTPLDLSSAVFSSPFHLAEQKSFYDSLTDMTGQDVFRVELAVAMEEALLKHFTNTSDEYRYVKGPSLRTMRSRSGRIPFMMVELFCLTFARRRLWASQRWPPTAHHGRLDAAHSKHLSAPILLFYTAASGFCFCPI
jgi:hypothetical protein